MPCEILTEGVLEAALRRELSPGQRTALLRHLREPCDACLDTLEGWTAEEMMLTPDALLSRQESEAVFTAIAPPPSDARRPGLALAPKERRWSPWIAWGAAAAVLALAGLAIVLPATEQDGATGVKGDSPPGVALIAFAGARTPAPHVVRALAHGGSLAPGEVLLLRIRLDARAWVYLLSQKEGEAAELLWPLQDAARHDAGEFELAEAGSALAIDPAGLGVGGRLLLIASPEPIGRRRLEVQKPLRTVEEVQRTFAGCGVDLLPVVVRPP